MMEQQADFIKIEDPHMKDENVESVEVVDLPVEEIVIPLQDFKVDEIDTPTNFKIDYNCRRCKISFSTKRESLLHKKALHDNDPELKKYICEICNKGFANHGNLYRHVKGHSNLRPHQCKVCGKCFAQQTNLQRHHSIHTEEKPFVCTVCQRGFTQQGNLKRHQLIHTGEKPYRCKRCGRLFSQRVNLNKHILLHQGYRPYSCDLCNKTFPVMSTLKKHLQKHFDKMNSTTEKAAEVFYECGLCRTIFNNFEDFQAHGVFCEIASEEQIETTEQPTEIKLDLDPSA